MRALRPLCQSLRLLRQPPKIASSAVFDLSRPASPTVASLQKRFYGGLCSPKPWKKKERLTLKTRIEKFKRTGKKKRNEWKNYVAPWKWTLNLKITWIKKREKGSCALFDLSASLFDFCANLPKRFYGVLRPLSASLSDCCQPPKTLLRRSLLAQALKKKERLTLKTKIEKFKRTGKKKQALNEKITLRQENERYVWK